MLTSKEIEKLKQQPYYQSTTKLINNADRYRIVKKSSNNILVISEYKIIKVLINAMLVVMDFAKIKQYVEFRNANIEMFLKNESICIGREIIYTLMQNRYKWLDVRSMDFREKLNVIIGDTAEITRSNNFQNDVKNVLRSNRKMFDSERFYTKRQALLDEYDDIIIAWNRCFVYHGTVSLNKLREEYECMKFTSASESGNLTRVKEYSAERRS